MVTTTREPGEQQPYEGTKEQQQEQRQQESNQREQAERATDKYWRNVG